MSASELSRILSYALVDQDFSNMLASDPRTAATAVDANLSPNEFDALAAFSVTDFREAVRMMSDREPGAGA